MSNKDDRIRQLQDTVDDLEDQLSRALYQLELYKQPKHRHKHAGALSFDFWPLRDWFRLSVKKWNPGKYAQVCIGPIRLDFWED
jgi:hypothetical protein